MTGRPGIGFIGCGRFGTALGERFVAAGFPVRAWDPFAAPPPEWRAASPAEVAGASETVILAVPVVRTKAALEEVRPHLAARHLVMDVGSVKSGPMAALADGLGRDVPWIGSHPLFGPTSLALGERPLTVILTPGPWHPGAAGRARGLYEAIGCEVHEEDPGRHDELMAESHALAYFVAKGFIDAGLTLDFPYAPPSARAIARVVEAVREDAGHLFASLHRENPYAAAARRRLLDALAAADRGLEAPVPAAEEPHHEPISMEIPDLGARSPQLKEAREVIDEIDARLVSLLVRRAEMARRAARAKAELGRAVQDPRREAELLADRRRRAAEAGLSPDDLNEVFEAILRFSRRVQGDPKGL